MQKNYEIRFEWGLEGAKRLSSWADVAIIVDVLSFSTCIDIAVSLGVEVFPYPYGDAQAERFAESLGAIYAQPIRSKTKACLSPRTLGQLRAGDKLVLPSPNGATIALSVQSQIVLVGCLRNASAVARAARRLGRSILIIAAGERWDDNSLRPSLEDMLGAGAIISDLYGNASPEAMAALYVFKRFQDHLPDAIETSSSGQELVLRGFPEDNDVASALNVSKAIPILRRTSFVQLSA